MLGKVSRRIGKTGNDHSEFALGTLMLGIAGPPFWRPRSQRAADAYAASAIQPGGTPIRSSATAMHARGPASTSVRNYGPTCASWWRSICRSMPGCTIRSLAKSSISRALSRRRTSSCAIWAAVGLRSLFQQEGRSLRHWKASMTELAACPNVSVKLGGVTMRLAAYDYSEAAGAAVFRRPHGTGALRAANKRSDQEWMF